MSNHYLETTIAGTLSKAVKVGKKTVFTILVPDYYLSKQTNHSELDSYQVNIFEKDLQKQVQENPFMASALQQLDAGESVPNVEMHVKLTKSKTYVNNKGQKVFPHMELKFINMNEKFDPTDIRDRQSPLVDEFMNLETSPF